jgi:hypothetical protein
LVTGATPAYFWSEAASGKRAALAEGDEEARGESGAGTRQGAEEGIVGQLGGELADLVVETVDSGAGGAELGEQDLYQQSVGLDGCGVGGQRQLSSDGHDAAIDGVLIADVVAPKERDEGFAPSTLSEL